MANQTPTTLEIALQIVADIEAELGQTIPLLPKAVFRVLGFAIAGVFTILYKFGGWQFLQIFPSTAGAEALERWGYLVDVIRAKPVSAILNFDIVGANDLVVPTGTQVVDTLTQVVYIFDADGTIVAGSASVEITALQAGAISNEFDNAQLSFVTPFPGVNSIGVVSSTVRYGADAEALEDYRARVVDRFRKVPQGGAYADYEKWAEEVATIKNAYPYSGDVEGTVQVYSESSVAPNGIPNTTELNQVLASINKPYRRPVTASVYSLPITRTSFTVLISGLEPDTLGIREAIENALEQYFLSREPFIDGLSIINYSYITITQIISIIATATQINSAIFTNAQFFLSSDLLTPINTYQLGQGEKAKVSAITYD